MKTLLEDFGKVFSTLEKLAFFGRFRLLLVNFGFFESLYAIFNIMLNFVDFN